MATATLPKPKTATTAIATIPEPQQADERIERIPVEFIDIGENVRKTVGDVAELAASIAQVGLLQAVKVLGPFPDTGRYSLIYGQRRLTAIRSLGWLTIKAVVIAPGSLGTDARTQRVVEQLLENAQRADLAPLETAAALKVLVSQIGSQAETARQLGKSESWVSSTLKLLELAPEVTKLVTDGQLTASHAEAIAAQTPKEQIEFARWAVQQGASARNLEEHVRWTKGEQERIQSAQTRAANEIEGRVKKLIANLVKRSVPKAGQAIRVGGWGDDKKTVVASLKKHGYEDVTGTDTWYGNQPGKEFCDCKAWYVSVNYGEYTIQPICIVDAHRKAKQKADQDVYDAEHAAEKAAKQAVVDAVAAELKECPLGRLTLQLLFAPQRGQLDEWAKGKPGAGDKKKPDSWGALCAASEDELSKDLAETLAGIWSVPIERVAKWLAEQKAES